MVINRAPSLALSLDPPLSEVHVATNSHVCVFQTLAFRLLLLVLNRDRYFHLLWRQFGMSNPAKRGRGHAPPSGDTPVKNTTATALQARSRGINLVPFSELQPLVGISKVSNVNILMVKQRINSKCKLKCQ